MKDFINRNDVNLANNYLKKLNIKNYKNFNGKFSFLNEQVYSGFIRFRGTSIEEKNKSDNLTIYKEYFKSAILFYLGFKKILHKKKLIRL